MVLESSLRPATGAPRAHQPPRGYGPPFCSGWMGRTPASCTSALVLSLGAEEFRQLRSERQVRTARASALSHVACWLDLLDVNRLQDLEDELERTSSSRTPPWRDIRIRTRAKPRYRRTSDDECLLFTFCPKAPVLNMAVRSSHIHVVKRIHSEIRRPLVIVRSTGRHRASGWVMCWKRGRVLLHGWMRPTPVSTPCGRGTVQPEIARRRGLRPRDQLPWCLPPTRSVAAADWAVYQLQEVMELLWEWRTQGQGWHKGRADRSAQTIGTDAVGACHLLARHRGSVSTLPMAVTFRR